MRIDDDADRRAGFEPRQAHGEQRIVGENGSDADHDRIRMGAHEVHFPVGDLAREHQARAMAGTGEAFGAAREFDRHGRPPLRDPGDVAAMEPAGVLGKAAGGHGDPRTFEAVPPLPGGEGARIGRADHQPSDSGSKNEIGAGRAVIAAAAGGAGFERHIEGRAPGALSGRLKRHPLRMRPAARLRRSLSDDDRRPAALVHHHGADGRVRPGEAEMALAQGDGQAHEALVLRSWSSSDVLRLDAPARHGRHGSLEARFFFGGGGRSSSLSPSASLPRISSKSLASRKFL